MLYFDIYIYKWPRKSVARAKPWFKNSCPAPSFWPIQVWDDCKGGIPQVWHLSWTWLTNCFWCNSNFKVSQKEHSLEMCSLKSRTFKLFQFEAPSSDLLGLLNMPCNCKYVQLASNKSLKTFSKRISFSHRENVDTTARKSATYNSCYLLRLRCFIQL